MESYQEEESSLKEKRTDRKIASRTDRSFRKKTDQKKIKVSKLPETGINGQIHKIIADSFFVFDGNTTFKCSLKGTLKKNKVFTSNIAAVGDFVTFEITDNNEAVINNIKERKSFISQYLQKEKKEKIIASNLDSLLIVSSADSKNIDSFCIDRFLILAIQGNINPIIIINKIDLAKDMSQITNLVSVYEGIGIRCLLTSCKTNSGINDILNVIENQTVAFCGRSGNGKSSLINKITGYNLKTSSLSKRNYGKNTTTNSCIVRIGDSIQLIDTPGIQFPNIKGIEQHEVKNYFDEIFEHGKLCKYQSCSHINEKDCNVIEKESIGQISKLRYLSYCKMFKESKIKY